MKFYFVRRKEALLSPSQSKRSLSSIHQLGKSRARSRGQVLGVWGSSVIEVARQTIVRVINYRDTWNNQS